MSGRETRNLTFLGEPVVYTRAQDTGYGKLATYSWDGTIIDALRPDLEKKLDFRFDYVLVHIYETGEDHISPHFDSGALNSSIASVSFGAARKFRLRKMEETKGWEKEFRLVSGDVIVMWGPGKCGDALGCQRIYKHYAPKESKALNASSLFSLTLLATTNPSV